MNSVISILLSTLDRKRSFNPSVLNTFLTDFDYIFHNHVFWSCLTSSLDVVRVSNLDPRFVSRYISFCTVCELFMIISVTTKMRQMLERGLIPHLTPLLKHTFSTQSIKHLFQVLLFLRDS